MLGRGMESNLRCVAVSLITIPGLLFVLEITGVHRVRSVLHTSAKALVFRPTQGNMAAIVLALFATVGIGTLAVVSCLLYLAPGPRDRLD
jgi:hypothetical protein